MKYCFIEIFKHFNLEQHKTKTHKKNQNYIIIYINPLQK